MPNMSYFAGCSVPNLPQMAREIRRARKNPSGGLQARRV